tara:strand:- start:9 stop:269 length:261 start_codon:yes stop_codon:yes gene_type:complete
MAIIKETEIGKIEIVSEYKHIQVRTDTVIKEDGTELSRTYHRHMVKCNISDDDLAKEHADVQTIANSGIWTTEIKNAFIAYDASIG